MPWSHSSPMDQKLQFIADYLRQTHSLTELCQRYGISRKTAYQWVERYEQDGATGLSERSRRPHACPHRSPSCAPASAGVRWPSVWSNRAGRSCSPC